MKLKLNQEKAKLVIQNLMLMMQTSQPQNFKSGEEFQNHRELMIKKISTLLESLYEIEAPEKPKSTRGRAGKKKEQPGDKKDDDSNNDKPNGNDDNKQT